MKKILWLASYPKSGNTWLRSIVTTLLYTNNGNFNFDLLKLIEQYEKKIHFEFLKDKKKNEFKKIINKIELLSKYWKKSQENIVYNKDIKPIFNIYKTHSANIAINNNPFTNSELTAGCIYIVRDPREVLISFSHHRGANFDETIKFMSDIGAYFPTSDKNLLTYISRWDIHYKSWQKLDAPLLVLKYEDLVTNTSVEIKKIAMFLSKILNFEIKNLNEKLMNSIENTNITKFQEYEKKYGFNEASVNGNFFRSGKINTWKQKLAKDQIIKIEDFFKDIMIKFNYK